MRCRIVGCWMDYGLDRVWKKRGHDLMAVLSMYLLLGTEANHENPSVRVVGVSAKIRNQHLLNMSLEHHLYINPLVCSSLS
jgi:hypothetical protein